MIKKDNSSLLELALELEQIYNRIKVICNDYENFSEKVISSLNDTEIESLLSIETSAKEVWFAALDIERPLKGEQRYRQLVKEGEINKITKRVEDTLYQIESLSESDKQKLLIALKARTL